MARREAPQSARAQSGSFGKSSHSLAAAREERYAFLTEWYDPTAALMWSFQLFYYPKDGSVEMFDVKKHQKFLKRVKYDDLDPKDLYIGNRVNVLSRQLNLIDYGDEYTANKLGGKKERTLAVIKPDAIIKIGDLFELIHAFDLIVTKAKMTTLTRTQAAVFYSEQQSKPTFDNSVHLLSSGPVVAMELMGDDAVSVWKKFLEYVESTDALREARAQFVMDGTESFGHGSVSLAAAAKELQFFFPAKNDYGPPNTATFTDSTCCIIKPHAIAEGLTGKILNTISEAGFEILALQMFNMNRANAEEFFQVYKGVVPEYPGMVNELCSGACMALEILDTNQEQSFRDLCGPADPEISRLLRPNTLRALFGKDKLKNAVHCTDLPEDRVLEEERYAFLTEWFDPIAAVLRCFQLFYYPNDGSVEMFDMKKQQKFLKRIKYDDLDPKDLFIGNRVKVFSRQLNLVDYGDEYTANKLGSKKERTLALIKPDAVTKIGEVLEKIYASNLIVTKAKMTKLTWSQAADFYAEHQSKPFFNNSVHFLSSGPVVAMELMGDEAVSAWKKFLGPAESSGAQREAPQSARAQFGTDGIRNFGHGSDSLAAAARELEFFFPSTIGYGPPNTATYTDSTCCIIKPHAIAEGLTGKILNTISEAGFEILALQMFNMDRANAEEFFEVYKGVVPEYNGMVNELCSGACMALEILDTDQEQSFRDLCGPADPEVSRLLRPNTLRALFGKDKVKNAVHCTDLPEDRVLEVEYFFKILDG
ncbi:hypothetical protein fugu_005835 [Takifugu bimaculatus]|uniref:Nucleoside diphosphate kinase B n=1 Tax=Takifugu bimaculatus TaxID=433685 RepID=A0A4Z2B5H8_9TELE|nr:hypothetical protein fugu_005835 [Takifugu bimaculatus]